MYHTLCMYAYCLYVMSLFINTIQIVYGYYILSCRVYYKTDYIIYIVPQTAFSRETITKLE